jgi:hypothetical protein
MLSIEVNRAVTNSRHYATYIIERLPGKTTAELSEFVQAVRLVANSQENAPMAKKICVVQRLLSTLGLGSPSGQDLSRRYLLHKIADHMLLLLEERRKGPEDAPGAKRGRDEPAEDPRKAKRCRPQDAEMEEPVEPVVISTPIDAAMESP